MGSQASTEKNKKYQNKYQKNNHHTSDINEIRNILSREYKYEDYNCQTNHSHPNNKLIQFNHHTANENPKFETINYTDPTYFTSTNENKITNKLHKINLKTKGGSLNKDIRQYFRFREILGGGKYGTVRIGYKKGVEPLKFYAVKSISKKNLTPKNLENLIKEVEILSSLEHPNIIKFFETYHDQFYFHIVMELCEGKEVFEKITEEENITEDMVARYIFKILHAISYCHSNGITHRDLKPENILFEGPESDSEIKLIDFGLSRKFYSNEKMHTILGTPYYIAPEVLIGEYDEKCDIWSIGAITYTMLCGEAPFMGDSNNEIFKKIMNDEIKFGKAKWKKISQEAKDFIKNCLVKDPSLRWSASKALGHPWFKNILLQVHDLKNLSQDVLENIRNFGAHPQEKFKQLVLKYFVDILSESDSKSLRQAFYAIDLDHNGYINKEELSKAFKLNNVTITDQEISKIFEIIDRNEGKLDYSQFLICSFNQKKYINEEKLTSAFKHFDIDNNGIIDSSDIINTMLRSGREIINKEEVDHIITEVNDKKKLYYFRRIFKYVWLL